MLSGEIRFGAAAVFTLTTAEAATTADDGRGRDADDDVVALALVVASTAFVLVLSPPSSRLQAFPPPIHDVLYE